jgi:hypothetical protein
VYPTTPAAVPNKMALRTTAEARRSMVCQSKGRAGWDKICVLVAPKSAPDIAPPIELLI